MANLFNNTNYVHRFLFLLHQISMFFPFLSFNIPKIVYKVLFFLLFHFIFILFLWFVYVCFVLHSCMLSMWIYRFYFPISLDDSTALFSGSSSSFSFAFVVVANKCIGVCVCMCVRVTSWLAIVYLYISVFSHICFWFVVRRVAGVSKWSNNNNNSNSRSSSSSSSSNERKEKKTSKPIYTIRWTWTVILMYAFGPMFVRAFVWVSVRVLFNIHSHELLLLLVLLLLLLLSLAALRACAFDNANE